jgi:hypothetical protein
MMMIERRLDLWLSALWVFVILQDACDGLAGRTGYT